MAIKLGKLFGTDKLLGTDDDDLLIALGAKTTLDGGAGNDILLGGINDDILIGGKGADFLSGGLGVDTADYSASSAGVTVNLTTGKGSGGDAQGDTLWSIEKVIGSAFDDVLIGDKGNNSFTGGAGNDVFVATNGKDTITDFTPYAPDTPVVIDFNDLVPPYPGATQVFIEPGYGGLDWGNGVYGVSGAFHPTAAVLGLGTIVGYLHRFEPEGTITTVGADFTLKSAYMGRIFDENDDTYVQVMVQGWDDGALRVTQTFQLGHGRTLINFVGFDSIDTLKVVVTGEGYVGFDDIALAFEGSGDRIEVPVGTNIAALVASAVTDGHGGTLLKYQGGQLDLQGIAPGTVSADWFV